MKAELCRRISWEGVSLAQVMLSLSRTLGLTYFHLVFQNRRLRAGEAQDICQWQNRVPRSLCSQLMLCPLTQQLSPPPWPTCCLTRHWYTSTACPRYTQGTSLKSLGPWLLQKSVGRQKSSLPCHSPSQARLSEGSWGGESSQAGVVKSMASEKPAS